MTKPAKPYYANPGPAQERRDGCAMMLVILSLAAVFVAIWSFTSGSP
jgi:hypothetical protein